MRILVPITLFLITVSYFNRITLTHDNSTERANFDILPEAPQLDTIFSFTGIAIDSFTSECSSFAECVCVDNVRFKVVNCHDYRELKGKIIGVYIRCFEDRHDFKLLKDSSYLVEATTKFTPRVLISNKFEKDSLRQFWCNKIEPQFHRANNAR